MTADIFADAMPLDWKRDRWGRPLVVPPEGGKPVAYQRPSSFAKTIEDTWGLEQWARRNVAYGMARDSSLVARMLALPHDLSGWDKNHKQEASDVVAKAQEVAQAHKAADIGTALHKLTERHDLGERVDAGPMQERLDAYQATMRLHGVTIHPEWVECRMVCDELGTAGTADRIVTIGGRYYIADVKTGADLTYAGLGYAVQLGLYARSLIYDLATDRRIETPAVDETRGVIIHLPAAGGPCTLHWIDIDAGWDLAQLVATVKAAQKRKNWLTPVDPPVVVGPLGPLGPTTPPTTADVEARLATLTDEQLESVRDVLRSRGVRKSDPAGAMAVIDEMTGPFDPPPTEPKLKARLGSKAKTGVAVPVAPPVLEQPELVEGPAVDTASVAAIGAKYTSFDAERRAWLDAIARQANDAGVPIGLKANPTVRRFEISRGLMLLAEDGQHDDEVLRALVHLVTGVDAVLFADVTPGAAVGSLSDAEAVRFAVQCEAYCAGLLTATVGDDGALRLTEAAA